MPTAQARWPWGDWIVTAIDGAPVVDGTSVTVTIAAGHVYGHTGCNRFRTTYRFTDDDALTISPTIISTRMACVNPAAQAQERAFLDTLAAVTGFSLIGDTLTLHTGETAALTLTRALTLPGTQWVLVTLDGMEMLDETITLAFDAAGRITGSGGCNQFGGSYRTDGMHITISGIASTLRACLDDAVMSREAAYYRLLGAVTHYALFSDTLILYTANGGELEFAP